MTKVSLAMAKEQIGALIKYYHSDKREFWDIILAKLKERRKTVRAKRPVQQQYGKITPDCEYVIKCIRFDKCKRGIRGLNFSTMKQRCFRA